MDCCVIHTHVHAGIDACLSRLLFYARPYSVSIHNSTVKKILLKLSDSVCVEKPFELTSRSPWSQRWLQAYITPITTHLVVVSLYLLSYL